MKKVSIFVVFFAVLLFVAVPFAGASDGPSGKVLETMDSGGYTYVHVENAGQKFWVAIPQTKIKVGQNVTFQPAMVMKNFKSKSLNREFDVIYFSGGLAQ
jgi:hypothetical protein